MSLNPRFLTAPSLQQYFVDKTTGFPLAGGRIFFYQDTNREIPKTVFQLQGSMGNYSYSPLPNPIVLNNSGQVVDNDGNIIVIYYFPFDEDGNLDLYYIIVQDSLGADQQRIQAWPNPTSSGSETSNSLLNYVPNGQYLSHTDLPDNLLVPGDNPIAQGGFSIQLDETATSVNTIEFLPQQFTTNPPGSPRYIANFKCTSANSLEIVKTHRLKFRDVNKFTSDQEVKTAAFWALATTAVPVQIQIFKFFGVGGSAPVTITQDTATIGPEPTFFNFDLTFDPNSGLNVGDQGDDFIAIEISFPTDITFDVQLTDHVLSPGDVTLIGFPTQANADMMARGVFGWTAVPAPTGYDLYLPSILTKRGMDWDRSQIGRIEKFVKTVEEADASPAPQHNMLNCDGSVYINEDFAANGIPFARLGDYLRADNPHANNLPLYGTGADYVSSVIAYSGAATDYFRIVYNIAGAGSTLPAEGGTPTGFTFDYVYDYAGSTTGIGDFGYFSFSGSNGDVKAHRVGTTWLTAPSAGTTGFTITIESVVTGITAFQDPREQYFTLTPTTAAALSTGVGVAAEYWLFSDDATDYYMWFNVAGEIDPVVGGRTPIEAKLEPTMLAEDVGTVIIAGLNAFNAGSITIGSAPSAGSYFTFSSNPGALRNFYVWYEVNSLGTDPGIFGSVGIKVTIFSSDTPEEVRDATILATNQYQYQVPLFDGLFFRCTDPNAIYDADKDSRWSTVIGQTGFVSDIGTFEYDQFRSHDHNMTQSLVAAGAGVPATSAVVPFQNRPTDLSGGNETRAVNTTICPIIRY